MDFQEEILQPFLYELIEMYRHRIVQQNNGKEMTKTRNKLSKEIQDRVREVDPKLEKIINEYIECVYTLSTRVQEQLYIQGIKDGLRIRKMIDRMENGEETEIDMFIQKVQEGFWSKENGDVKS